MFKLASLCCLLLAFGASLHAGPVDPGSRRAELARAIVERGEATWRQCRSNPPPQTLSARWVFGYALALCEARVHPERLETLFDLAAALQDTDPKSRSHGNFRWYWKDPRVLDANAVDFCVRGGALMWLHHKDWIPDGARAKLLPLLNLAGKGLSGHKVKPSYSNIALMNAADLIMLGQALEQPALVEEGKKRLEAIAEYTREFGIHEYVSPTYTGVDLEGLGLLEAYAPDEATRARAQSLLQLWWTDTALNYFPPAQRLAGAHSRTYDFLYGLGFTGVPLAYHGWLDKPLPTDPEVLYTTYGRWQPPPEICQFTNLFPRLVRQSWGEQPWQSRTHYLTTDATLSASAACYGGWMDMPLTIDFPGGPESVRAYFIADARHDPYGKNKMLRGAHAKAFHVDPFWTAAQDGNHALAMVIYRPTDLPTNAVCLESNFVLPIEGGDFQIGEREVSLKKKRVARFPVTRGETVSVRRGNAIAAVRVLWSANTSGQPATLALVNDGNEYGAARLVIEHAGTNSLQFGREIHPGAVLWTAIGTGLKTEAEARQWLERFSTAKASVTTTAESVHAEAAAEGRTLAVGAEAPWTEPQGLQPPPTRAILELNGKDVGQALLAPR